MPLVGLRTGDVVPAAADNEVGVVTEEPSVIGELLPFIEDEPAFIALCGVTTGEDDCESGCGAIVTGNGVDMDVLVKGICRFWPFG
jgi:hypothetical protein